MNDYVVFFDSGHEPTLELLGGKCASLVSMTTAGMPVPPGFAVTTAAFDHFVDVVADGEPGLLYIGNAQLPRHVVLVLPGDGDRLLDVYDPGNGRVHHLRRDAVVERRIGLSGWQVPWFAVQPTGHRRVLAVAPGRALGAARVTSGA